MKYSRIITTVIVLALSFSVFAGNDGKTIIRFRQYDYELYSKQISQKDFQVNEKINEFTFGDSKWKLTIDTIAVTKESVDLKYCFECMDGKSAETSVSVVHLFDKWNDSNYVLIPAALYNGNKFDWRRIRYSPKLLDPRDIGKDIPSIITDVPRLNKYEGPSFVQLRSGAAATPSINFFDEVNKEGVILLVDEGNELGDYGLEVEEYRNKNEATLSVTSPLVRERYKYKSTDNQYPSDDRGHDFGAGDKFSIHIKKYLFAAENIQDLYNKFADVRMDMTSSNAKYNLLFPWSNLFAIQEKKFNTENWVDSIGYYSVGMRESFLQDWQIGWTGGMISTYPLLFSGSGKTSENVVRNFNWLFPDGIGKSGFFYGFCEHGTNWFGGDKRKFHTINWHLTRKSADAVFYILTQFDLMKKKGMPIHKSWEDGTETVCNAFVSLWEKNHQIGQFVDINTGEIIVGGSSSAGILPAGLVKAAHYFNNETYLETAKEIGAYYYREFTKKGITCGGPGDAMQNPDSESSYALVESYFALYEATSDEFWLKASEDAAKQFATWVISYNYNFPENSTYGKFNIKSLGGVFANTQNTHGAPGICTHAGLALLKLYRATGNRFYSDLLSDITHAIPQCFSHPDRLLPDARPGWMNERISTTDWNEGIGEMMHGSTWAETAMMLTYTQIPGIYLCPQKSELICFDNLKAEIIKKTSKMIRVRINNPTNYDASVRLWKENANQQALSLDPNYLLNCEIIVIKANSTVEKEFRL